MKTGLLQKIKDVISNDDTISDILNKILTKYPDVLEYKKTCYKGDEEKAHKQLKAEISSHIRHQEDTYFTINRDEHPNLYSPIDDTDDTDEMIGDAEADIGYVYFIDPGILTANGQKIVKIGVAINIEQRMKQLSVQQFAICKLKLIKHYKVCRPFKVEKALHCALDKGRVAPNKELFYVGYIEKNMNMIEMIIDNFKEE